jgi:hypothetical protein
MKSRWIDDAGNSYTMRPVENKGLVQIGQEILIGALIAVVAVGVVLLVSALI